MAKVRAYEIKKALAQYHSDPNLENKGLLSGWGKDKGLKYNWKEELDELLGSSFSSHEKYKIEAVVDAAEKLKNMI